MIDRKAREKVIAAIDCFLNDRTDAFEFDDQIWIIESEDETVAYAVQVLWFHYDDFTNHKAVLQKCEWDLIQRIKLLLMSDAVVVGSSESRWSWDHALAFIGFLCFLAIAVIVGWGWHLLIVGIPFGLISIGITRYRERYPVEYLPRDSALYPFDSLSQIWILKRRFPDFSKQKYRKEVGRRRIRSRPVERFLAIYSITFQILLGPLALLFQGISSPACESVGVKRP